MAALLVNFKAPAWEDARSSMSCPNAAEKMND